MKTEPNSTEERQQTLPDMSGAAIMNRLRLVGELNELCRFLGNSDLSSRAKGQNTVSTATDKGQPMQVAEKA